MKRALLIILCAVLLVGAPGAEANWFKADGILGPVSMVNSSGALIDPATEDKQDDAISELVDIKANQTDGSQTTQIVNSSNVAYSSDPYLTACIGEQVALSRISYINKFGRNPIIDTNTDPEDIWDAGGLWVPPTLARVHDIASTSDEDAGTLLSTGTADTTSSTVLLYDVAADFVSDGVAAGDAVLNDTNIDHSIVTSVTDLNTLVLEPTHHLDGFNLGDTYRVVTPAATGVSVVHLYGLDSNFEEAEEFIMLDGNPAGAGGNVATSRAYWRVYRMHSDGAASRIANNIGVITATAQTDATVTAQINVANGQTLMAIYPIPAGKTGCMTRFSSTIYKGAVGALANMSLRQTKFASVDGAGSIIEHYYSLATDGSSNINHPYLPYKRFEQKTDIWLRVETVTANTTEVTGSFDIILVDNN